MGWSQNISLKKIFFCALFFIFTFSLLLPQSSSSGQIVFVDREQSQELGEADTVGFLPCDNGLETFKILLKALEEAKHSAELGLCLAGGEILLKILQVLEERFIAEPAFKAFLILQPIFLFKEEKERIEAISVKFGDRFQYVFTGWMPSPTILNPNVIEMHVKLSIIDSKYFFIGGTNFEDFMCTEGDKVPEVVNSPRLQIGGMARPLAFRDQDVVGRSTLLGSKLREEFHKSFVMWKRNMDHLMQKFFDPEEFSSDPEVLKNLSIAPQELLEEVFVKEFEFSPDLVEVEVENVKVIFSGPHDGDNNPITLEYKNLINEAKTSIKFSQMYFIPVSTIFNSVIDAVLRGVNLEIISNGSHENSPQLTSNYAWGNRIRYIPLMYGRDFPLWGKKQCMQATPFPVSVYEFDMYQTQLHKKSMLVDDEIFIIGSYNFCKKSHNIDYESVIVIRSKEFARKANKIFQKDKSLSRKISCEQAVEWYFDPTYYILGSLQVNFMPA
ncbi:phospholipase D-like domain-containing protein [Chlamydiifrater phoenicopteri]|uniref:phospholipase D-like domain-containing protein n=1 Tax=Chlamydiifrater phoenicopteri TaxID=2681469 RepID=UPI001BD080AC|nr:phosphatidylserine/phosphatidylglycerophosphate/cardiolipin synthase family protein [Chlamydiifrater phoenicopteri]